MAEHRVSAWIQAFATTAGTAGKSVFRQTRRTLMALLAVAFGVISLILAGGFIDWNLRFGREATIHSQLGHIRIHLPGYLDEGHARPHDFLFSPTGGPLSAALKSERIVAVAPRLSFNGLASTGEQTLSFIGEGVDPAAEATLSRSIRIETGRALSGDDDAAVMLGKGLAANLGARPGDRIVLMSSTRRGGVSAVEVEVVGIFSSITKAYDDAALRVPLATAQRLAQAGGVHALAVVLDDTAATDAELGRLRQVLGDRFETVPWYELADFYRKTAALFAKQVAMVHLIIAAIIVLSISNSMMMAVLERTREIGTAMALGVPRGRILLNFLIEGLLVGLVGAVAGVVIGGALAMLISAVGIPMPPGPGMAFSFRAGILVTPAAALQAVALALGTTFLASLYPAYRASRMTIVDALRTGT